MSYNINKVFNIYILNISSMGIGDWGLGIGDWGLGIGPNPQSPIEDIFKIQILKTLLILYDKFILFIIFI